ncbi:hypothetical protein D3C71_1867150 [compost metagenome]
MTALGQLAQTLARRVGQVGGVQGLGHRDRGELGVVFLEGVRRGLVLAAQHGAGDEDQTSARLHQRRGAIQDLNLQGV